MAARFILDELDLDLASFASRLVLVVLLVLTRGALSWTLDATGVDGAIATGDELVLRGRRVFVGDGGDVGHDAGEKVGGKVVRVV